MGKPARSRQPHGERDRMGGDPFWLFVQPQRSSAGVAAIAIRIAIAHAAPARGAGLLMTRRVAGGAGLAGPAAFLLHPMSGRITGGARLAGHRPTVLHLLARCAVRHALA